MGLGSYSSSEQVQEHRGLSDKGVVAGLESSGVGTVPETLGQEGSS